MDIFFDGVDVFDVLFFGVCIVHAKIAKTVVQLRSAEVNDNGFGVSDVEIAVRLGREARVDGQPPPCVRRAPCPRQ